MTFPALFRIHLSQGVDSACGVHLRPNGPGRGSSGPSIEENSAMTIITAVIACGLLSVLYAIWATRSVLASDQGNQR
ncbi:MAG: hypothetical protein E5X10_20825, partial [Mesorhizobium sp.]